MNKETGARPGYGRISQHAFLNGNKRIGISQLLSFLETNGIRIKCTGAEPAGIGRSAADGNR